MSSQLLFARLSETIMDMEQNVGLRNFTSNEQQVYAVVILLFNDTTLPLSIQDIRSHYLLREIPMPNIYWSFYRSIRAKKICHIGNDPLGLHAII